MGQRPVLGVEQVTLGYGERAISRDLDLQIRPGSFTVILGPNACGKSTLLRSLARVLTPSAGRIVLDGKDLHRLRARDVARRLGLLPQTALAPDGITVVDLVSRGRFPHRSLVRRWTDEDDAAVERALAATRTVELADRLVDELSGGQRQRVWVAMLLAQETELMLLDEPTTFLDIAHQYELLELLRGFHEHGRTLVVVLHDLNQAARYATDLVVMHEGEVVTTGAPQDVVTPALLRDVFSLDCLVVPDPASGTPMVVPTVCTR
ncbi:MAG: ABC transporter ATP-binding protein [Brachybacterium tyrofermentans]|uniref:ABC transporter ATP-binding protein n=1 Tax=Brachybacterium TaxID=43668 RepID=UPI003F8DDB23